ncbi:ferritin heavy chain A-like isoform X2 [Hemicordylus capensis]|uniref:ferritin heavy chain A-like isoform X2 n=1 Tax=Hemicordylus capensis TaxID=884348 RepID=UPI0023023CFF|nr:ferritin heavy chain A-like isoform X2 [Hemicordylus capensis]
MLCFDHINYYRIMMDAQDQQNSQEVNLEMSAKDVPLPLVRQNLHKDCEATVNQMVNLELYASYAYLSMSCHFDRDDVALGHMAKFLKEQSQEKREHAKKFLKYQNKRGGRVVLKDIQKPEQDEWGSSLEALEKALKLEKEVNQALLDLHKLAMEKGDPHHTKYGLMESSEKTTNPQPSTPHMKLLIWKGSTIAL